MTNPAPQLPFVDEYVIRIAAPPDAVWTAVHRYAERALHLGKRHPLALLLGTEPPSGFAIEQEQAPRLLDLTGRHRFSRYRLTFEVAAQDDGETLLAARTHAAFPGPHGRVYRTLVIASGLHGVAVRGMLASIQRASVRAG